MKRFWLQLPEKSDVLEITASNNKFSLFESSTERSYTIAVGKYTLEKLIEMFTHEGLVARIGQINADMKAKFLVLFLNPSFTNINGNFISFIGGIESIDTGDRQEESIIH
ncbi:hypothetical protein ACIQ1H_13580 [Lysinibacillus sp. NPDC097279]|uniref:hypothetical protein n=1 Tax=Lysinibacillus sp. NPDC097279 TaxID=3364143 RepID=UPI0038309CAE